MSKTPRSRDKQRALLLALTLAQLRNLHSKLGITYTPTDSRDMLVNRLMDPAEYPAGISPKKITDTPQALSGILLLPFWKSPAGIDSRIEALAGDFSYQTVGATMVSIAQEMGIALQWVLHPEDSKTGPCPECIDNSENGDYDDTYGTNLGADVYAPHGDLPEYPAHNNCRCEWVIIYEEGP